MKGGVRLGYAKYMEDDREIFNSRMYDKGIGLVELSDFKRSQKASPQFIPVKEEYLLVLNALEKVDIWLDIIEDAKGITNSQSFLQLLDSQERHVNNVKSEYINYKFDPKFRRFEDLKIDKDNREFRVHRMKLIESYIQYFIDNLKKMKNLTDADAMALNFFYWDMEQFTKEFLSIDMQMLKVPLVQYLREEILDERKKAWIKCPNCSRKTYRDFHTCIHCKYPNEVK